MTVIQCVLASEPDWGPHLKVAGMYYFSYITPVGDRLHRYLWRVSKQFSGKGTVLVNFVPINSISTFRNIATAGCQQLSEYWGFND
jgi:hypothetical protein